MRGRRIGLSPARRFMIDLMRLCLAVPIVSARRRMHLGPVAAARRGGAERPSWVALFVKAYALAAEEEPVLRRAYVKLPWPHLYEYETSAAVIAFERVHDGEEAVFLLRVKNPAGLALRELDRIVRHGRTAPVEAVKDFRRLMTLGRLPGFLRRLLLWIAASSGRQRGNYFGTFGLSVYTSHGADPAFSLAPGPLLLTYGLIAPDGAVDVTAMWDHRVMDGAVVARALRRLEEILNGPIAAELASPAGETACAAPALRRLPDGAAARPAASGPRGA